jgi:hypothetical protein
MQRRRWQVLSGPRSGGRRTAPSPRRRPSRGRAGGRPSNRGRHQACCLALPRPVAAFARRLRHAPARPVGVAAADWRDTAHGRAIFEGEGIVLMSRVIDHTRQTFGLWTVLERAQSNGKRAQWLCRCTCGTERVVDGGNLRGGYSKSCGCIGDADTAQERANAITSTATPRDLTHEIFNLFIGRTDV